jgi:DNA polymerase I
MTSEADRLPLCGVWVDDHGHAHVALATEDGGRVEAIADFRPFAWLAGPPPQSIAGVETRALAGEGTFRLLAEAASVSGMDELLSACRAAGVATDSLRPIESQFLLQRRRRLYEGLPFARLRRCQLDIETAATGEDAFSDPAVGGDRVLAIGLRFGERTRLLTLADDTDEAECALLRELNSVLADEDPDTIEGHNLFRFDLDYLRRRARRYKVPCLWGRFGQHAQFRPSRLKLAERWVDFPRCDLPGRAVIDTYLLVQLYDVSVRELASYGLKEVALHFGITDEEADERTYLAGSEIQHVFRTDRPRFEAYLLDDLRETRGLADLLLPTYVEQARTFPTLLQEATLRGQTGKIDLLFLEEYYHRGQACPTPAEVAPFEGGFTRSFREGVFRHVLHFDVASLYPSLLLAMGRNPRPDSLGIFIPLLTRLREYRLQYKQLARQAPDPAERAEAQARQANFKILINSFYGYLGFSGARFGDGELAAEVTRRGRELLQALIAAFEAEGACILEADTDGIYLSSERWFAEPEALLARVSPILPVGIDLEFDGSYRAMFCYKAKNYALFDGERTIVRGSALRSRGVEPFLRRLTTRLVRHLVGAEPESPVALWEDYRRRLADRSLPVAELAKSEYLSQSPAAYEKALAAGGKPRRASAEAALQLNPRPRLGDRVSYYILPKAKGRTADWARARPLALYDPVQAPYDPDYYRKKLDDWMERYGPFLSDKPAAAQGELFGDDSS